jgi:hypothetical protein
MAALDKAEVNIQAGRENSVSFTMNADDFITPDISGAWVNQDKNLTISDPSATLAITLAGAAAFPLSADGPTALPVRGITKMRVEPEPILTLPRFLSSVPEQRPLALR